MKGGKIQMIFNLERDGDKIQITLEERNMPLQKRIKNLIWFVDNFKHRMKYSTMANWMNIILIPAIADDKKKLTIIFNAIKQGKVNEQQKIYQNDLDTTRINFELLKSALVELLELVKNESNDSHKTIYKKTSAFEIMNTKVTKYLFDSKTDFSEERQVSVGKTGKKDVIINVQAYVAIDGKIIPTNFTAYDREVLNGICSIYASGQNIMTTQTIYEAFTGRRNPSSQSKAHVTRSINKMRSTLLSIDWTNHAKMSGLPLEDEDYIKSNDNLLLMQNIEANINGTDTNAFLLLQAPILYKYAKSVGQIVTIDKSLLQMDNLNNTDDSIVLKNYILTRIAIMKNPKNKVKNHAILFDTMFEYCQITGNKNEMRRKRELVTKILDELKKKQYITNYTIEKKGNKYKSIVVSFIREQSQNKLPQKRPRNALAESTTDE